MAIRDDDFVENQIALAAKGLSKIIDLSAFENLFHKDSEADDKTDEYDEKNSEE